MQGYGGWCLWRYPLQLLEEELDRDGSWQITCAGTLYLLLGDRKNGIALGVKSLFSKLGPKLVHITIIQSCIRRWFINN